MSNVNPTLEEWLKSIGMGQHAPLLARQSVTIEALAGFTDDDLKGHGIGDPGDREKILQQMQHSLVVAPDETPATASVPVPTLSHVATPTGAVQGVRPSSVNFPMFAVPTPTIARATNTPVAAVNQQWQQPDQHPVATASAKPSRRKLFAGKFLLISIAVHVLLGLGAAYVIVQQFNAKRKITFQGGPPTINPSKRALEHKVALGQKKKSGGAPAQAKRIATTGIAKISLPQMPVIAVTNDYTPSKMAGMGGMGFGTGMGVGMGGGSGMGGGGGGGGSGINMLPPSLKSRCGSTDRMAKLIQNGGSPKCEEAVSLSLDWLKGKQNPDGSWGATHRAAMTGFALLCYLGRCVTPDDPKYGENVMKGILYLIELSKKSNNGLITSVSPPSSASIYEHGIATYALGEMYALAKLGKKELPGMKEAFEGGVGFVIAQQLDGGGWHYYKDGYDSTGAPDLSVSGWQYQALKAAKLTALPIHGLHESIEKAVKYLKSTQNHTKGANYPPGGFGSVNSAGGYNQWALSGVGILGLQTLDKGGSSPAILSGIQFASSIFKKTPPDWATNCNLYAWYYYSQVYFQRGGSEWKRWNDSAMTLVLANQNSDGTWKAEGTSPTLAFGSSHAGSDAEIYRTCLCTLMLEVYYRYLKVGDH